jgi:outer membrane beta-barrel protein
LSRASAVVLVLLALPALAQEGLGLDLSQEAQTPPQETAPAAPQAAPPSTVTEPGASRQEAPSGEPLDAEREVTLDDRVKSVQRKVYLKRHRFELAPFFAFSVNDPYFTKVGASLRGGYYLADTLALAARVSAWRTLKHEDARTAKFAFQSQVFASRPVWSALADVEWSPLYGKVAFLNDILHFDAYLLGGAGVVTTEASAARVTVNGQETVRGPSPAVDLGVGARFVARDFIAVNVALINTTFVDQPTGISKAATQNLMTLNVGISVFFPFTSTGRDSE